MNDIISSERPVVIETTSQHHSLFLLIKVIEIFRDYYEINPQD